MKITGSYKCLLLFGLFCGISSNLKSQVAITNGACNLSINIPDNNCVEVAININTAPGDKLGQNVFLDQVQLVINHGWRNDLDVRLIAPDGLTEIKLISERGGSGDHFGDPSSSDCSVPLILSQSSCGTDSIKNIASSTVVEGTYFPEEDLAGFYLPSPIDPNGLWTFKICDDKFGDVGTLEFAELIFIPPGCPAPTNVEAFNIRPQTIDLVWNNNGNCGGNVIIEYGPTGFTPGNGTTPGSASSQVVVLPCFEDYDLLNLEELTVYDIYIRQTCSDYSYSYNSCKITAQTDCILPPTTLSENFDTQSDCNADGTCLDCPTLSGIWKNATMDDIDWIVNSGSTVTSNTGPSKDANFNGKYIYLESSGTCKPSKEAILISDCVEVNAGSGICHLSFYYHMYGININQLFLEITTDGINWTPIWNQTGDQGNRWIRQYINLSTYHERVVQFRFRGISASINFRGDIGLDRITFYGSQLQASDIFYADLDNDGYGDPTDSISVCFASPPNNYVNNNLDCDDTNPDIHPDAPEIPCNGIDENCNGNEDDSLIFDPSFSVTPICEGEKAIISVNSATTGGQIYWYEDNLSNTPLDSGAIFITPVLESSRMYYFQEFQQLSGQECNSTLIPVAITVRPTPMISNASGNQNICQNGSFDLRSLIIQDANNSTDTLLYYSNDSYSEDALLSSPVVSVFTDSVFYVQARSISGCTDELPISFFRQLAPVARINAPDTLALCFQGDPQLISASEEGGSTGPFEFAWNTGTQNSETIVFSRSKNFLQTLKVTVTSKGNGCIGTDSIIVKTLPSISTISVLDVQEPGFCLANGTITLNPGDGQTPFSYAWNGAVSGSEENVFTGNHTISDLETGAYNITVSDNYGCSKVLPQQFVRGADFGIDRIRDVSCFGQSNGAIEIRVNGLVNPTYQWSNGTDNISTDQNIYTLSSGVYFVTVDADNVAPCAIDSIIVQEPSPIEILTKNISSPGCPDRSDGSVELVVSGGTRFDNDYNYSWSVDLGNTSNPQGLATGTYLVTISDALNCTISDSIVINPTPVLEVSLTENHPKCFGEDNGEIYSTITGGTAPFNYLWNDSLTQTTASAYGLSAGTYSLSVTDANGCQETSTLSLNNPALLSSQVDTIQSPLCNEVNDGLIKINVSGGTPGYSYLWSTTDSTSILSNIGDGIYSVSITDANNCITQLDSIQVVSPKLMQIDFSTIQNPLCAGLNNGSLAVEVSGGVSPYDFTWNNSESSATIESLVTGQYTVTVTDANGCTSTSDTVQLTAPQLLSVENFLFIDSVQCKGTDNGIVFISANSMAPGASSYSFSWLDSTLMTDNSNGFWLSSDFTTLSAGYYEMEIMDNVGCTLHTGFEVTEPDSIQIDTIHVEPPTCFGERDGNAIASIKGGTSPYIFNWTLPNNRIERTSDNVLPDIGGGNYTLQIIDTKNCISPPYSFFVASSSKIEIANTAIQSVSCSSPETGFIDIEVNGGRGQLSYEWNNGLLTSDLVNIDAGIYSVTITDEAECAISETFEIRFTEDSLLVDLVQLDLPDCDNTRDGSIEVLVNGGFGSYQYFWSNGTQNFGNERAILDSLPAGNYSVSVVDESNDYLCIGHLPEISLIPEGSIRVMLDSFDNELKCFEDSSGVFFITPSGGTAPYQYLWSNGITTQNAQNLPAGNYQLTITDAKNCTWTSGEFFPEIVEPSSPFELKARFVTDSLCENDVRGKIEISATGGTAPYIFSWNNGASSAILENLGPGNYQLTTTDNNGCSIQLDTSIAFKQDRLTALLETTNLKCSGDISGIIQSRVICGAPPYKYQWNTGDTTRNLTNLLPGTYSLTITDSSGEEIVESTEIRAPSPLQIDSVRVDIVDCEGMITLDVSGGVPNSYSYTWRDETGTIISTNYQISNLEIGNYQVTVQDANNCSVELADLSIDNEAMIDSIFTSADFNAQSNRGTLKIDSIKGGTAPYTYLWFNDDGIVVGTKETVPGVILGNYYVIVSDQNGCEKRQDQVVDRTISLMDLSMVTKFELFPNPVQNKASLNIQLTHKADIQLLIFNSTGIKIQEIGRENTAYYKKELDFSDFPSGIFFIQLIINDTTTYGEKILVSRN